MVWKILDSVNIRTKLVEYVHILDMPNKWIHTPLRVPTQGRLV